MKKCSRFLIVLTVTIMAIGTGCRGGGSSRPATPPLTILYNVEEEPNEKSAVVQVLQSQLGSAGIPVQLEPVSNAVFYQRIGAGNFQCAFGLWYLDYPDPEGFLTDFYSKAGFRMSAYNNADYDNAYLGGLLSATLDGKKRGFEAAEGILGRDLPWIPLYSNDELFLLTKGTDGFRSNAYQYYDYRLVAKPDVRVASNVELQTLDPALVYDLASKHVVTQSYEGLVAMGPDLQIIPALSQSWNFSPSGDRLIFHLRGGVRFHNGFGTLTAGDVKASFERMLRSNSPYGYIFDHVVGVEDFRANKSTAVTGFEVKGPLEFAIHFTQPFPTMLNWLLAPAANILPSRIPAKYDFSKGSVGTGPFILKSWDGSVARFEANPNYWGKDENGKSLPKPKTLSIRVMKDVNAMLTAFRQEELDILDVPVALYPEILDQHGNLSSKYSHYQLRAVPLNNLKFLAFRMGNSPWGTSAELRHKVGDAINRQLIVTDFFRGHARPDTTVIPSGMSW